MKLIRLLTLGAAAGAFAQFASAATISVTYSEDFAEELVEEYGEREGERLSAMIIGDLEQEMERESASVARIAVTIEDAKPNRPTFEQLSARPGLDPIRSISIGGMKLSGVAFDDDGNEVATMEYDWFSNNIRDSVGTSTWWDARRASDRFADRLVKELMAE
ncbi:MAG: hypothetical protein AAF216_01130 [Pseudomonadota bacterium]